MANSHLKSESPQMIQPSLRIFVTGGTFDKKYDERRGVLHFIDTSLPEMLKLGRNRAPIEIETLMMIDSLDMSDSDRQLILKSCIHAQEKNILITHGTDTMEITAKVLGKAQEESKNKTSLSDKVIVLTGAMIPYAFGSSDGLFNLGAALAFAQSLTPGVYVAMNGQAFAWHNVHKNKTTGYFEAKQ